MTKEILDLCYIGLYDDGTIGVSDGVGYVGTLDRDEVELLYEALHKIYGPELDNMIEANEALKREVRKMLNTGERHWARSMAESADHCKLRIKVIAERRARVRKMLEGEG